MKANPDKGSPWHHFHQAFRHFDRGFKSVDLGSDWLPTTPRTVSSDGKVHTLTASTWRKRWKLFCMFQGLAWKLVFRGTVKIKL